MPSKPLMDVTDNLGWKTFFNKKNYCNFFLPSISCKFSAPFIPLSLNLTENECSAENDDTESIDFFSNAF